ncbi:phosphatase PAP2 family protein [Ramlibacter sp. WS9]|uniref:phosphatase PAP2 family protein n=1 Tax=Ramlibacter sp. WS9 TaxID=1882741 RepID=UPI0011446EB9|nr:phosphatase PAP2 family protein [Ramlibacter sp. WS9]ROZ78893.1 phosphatase PAP2 family protein [Ramlibacter sp. WS9]
MNQKLARWLVRPRVLAFRRRFARQLAFVQARLSPQGYLGLQLTVGAAVLVGAGWLFGGVAEDVVTGDALTLVDVHIAQWLHAHAIPSLTRFMLLVSRLHDPIHLGAAAFVLGLVLFCKRQWQWLLIVVLCVPGGMLVNTLMKLAFQRARPSFDDPIVILATYSFPSGHVAGATLFYGVMATMLITGAAARGTRMAIAMVAMAAIALVAVSRMYLGAHFLSDIIAGFAEAVAWLTLCVVGTRTYFQHRAQGRRRTHPPA